MSRQRGRKSPSRRSARWGKPCPVCREERTAKGELCSKCLEALADDAARRLAELGPVLMPGHPKGSDLIPGPLTDE